MKRNPIFLILTFYSLFLLGELKSSLATQPKNENQVYIVYMGGVDSTNGSLRKDHDHVLNMVLRRNEKALVHNYKYGFSGFAARLSKNEANSIAQQPGVVSVFLDPILKLHTTRSWDFLNSQTYVEIDNTLSSSTPSSSDICIPTGWNGTCMTSKDFNSSNCNRKIIGARYYPNLDGGDDNDVAGTPRDMHGHGTHTASTAAGNVVSGASYFGLAAGTAKGGSPGSRLSIYKVCNFGCSGSAILAAFDDAISDGVDILSVSLGGSPDPQPDLKTDVIAIGAFHAVERGIVVICSAGNSGPEQSTVVNDAPWILTVAATTIDRDFQSNVVLGNNKVVKGQAINFSPLSKSPNYPLITGESAKKKTADLTEARQCSPSSLDKKKVKGKIVICDAINDIYPTFSKIETVQKAGGLGLVHISDQDGAVVNNYAKFPATVVRPKDNSILIQYINSTSNPMGTILPTVTIIKYKPAPMVAIFSSRGPSSLSKNILKPDIAAPGVNIVAAGTSSPYSMKTGTSMSCPHVSGLAGSIKSRNPTWSASAIRSAIMTSATQINNMKGPIATDLGLIATPYDYGAGGITTTEPLQPGLVYETSTIDYLNFLCYIGYNTTTIKVISKTVPDSFNCPKDSTRDHISNINYPSIAISNFGGKGSVNVSRIVTNVGEEEEIVYSAVVNAPSGVKVQLIPEKLQFTKRSKKQSYQVIFSSNLTSLKEDLFGFITWRSGKYSVRSPFVLTV
ncbi:subtilisin-like serine protease [Medicago truncatula]|uniref:Subtilisin-like serine protease n=1 Tax=Medicago truncatula TaxID=3880 RepID=A0A072UXP6_MEDTR|nr:subtilisin-like serine protease [Medicago truncatula]